MSAVGRPATLALALLVVAATGQVGCSDDDAPASDTARTPAPAGGGAQPGDDEASFDRIPDVVDAVAPSVVAVATQAGEGSGVVIDRDGVVVTNAHVVGEAEGVGVTLADATRVRGTVVAADRLTDLAVLRVDRDDLPAAELADDLPEVGELAVAIGNPLGFENSVTAGIISGLGREFPGAAARAPALIDLIQTDAPISPGNSGGALVDAEGRVVGINVAYVPPAGGAVSIGFAIPASTVASVTSDLLEDGEVAHAFLGAGLQPLTPQLAATYDLPTDEGALVLSVSGEGAAAEAGLEAGDIVVAAEGEPVRTVEDVLAAVRSREPGDELDLTVIRDGEELDVVVTLARRPGPG